MYCKLCHRYIKGFKARVKHQLGTELTEPCLGLSWFFIVVSVKEKYENTNRRFSGKRS